MADERIRQEMMAYYDARAPNHDELYSGAGRVVSDLQAYKREVDDVGRFVARFSRGHLIDVGCGAGYWLPYYAESCSHITMIDQSASMLSECAKKIRTLGIEQKCRLMQGDFLEMRTDWISGNSVLVGFVISHSTDSEEKKLFDRLKQSIDESGCLIVLDSAWTAKRKQFREKEGMQQRVLNDGRTFRVYKRYFTESDVESMFRRHGLRLESCHVGDMFLAASGRMQHA